MLLPFAILVLASQLLTLVADTVPEFNIARGSKVDNTASSLDVGLSELIKNCMRQEQQARKQLQAQWSQFAPSGRSICISATTGTEGDGVPPSYVELLTCLQEQLAVRKLED